MSKLKLLLTLCSMLTSSIILASTECRSIRDMPATSEPTVLDNQLVVTMPGAQWNPISKQAPAFRYSAQQEQWSAAGVGRECRYGNCPLEKKGCPFPLPSVSIPVELATQLRSFRYLPENIDTKIMSCDQSGDWIYFGIGFYAGEGTSGVGGLGRFNQSTQQLELRWPSGLRDHSVTHLKVFGDELWGATAGFRECGGIVVGTGIFRYRWDNGLLETQRDSMGLKDVCGHVSYGLAVFQNKLWVSTELGLSEFQPDLDDKPDRYSPFQSGQWRHWMPENTATGPSMSLQDCREEKQMLLRTLSQDASATETPSRELLVSDMMKLWPSEALILLSPAR